MRIGTKSILFGVHQFLWHPFTVARAYRFLYGRWPSKYEWCGILFHDLGYWGLPNIDGPEGRLHPVRGSKWAGWAAEKLARLQGHRPGVAALIGEHIENWTLGHSRELAKSRNREPSLLCWADKMCCFFDPSWFYLLRAHLSGEVYEFRANARGHVPDDFTYADWYRWYRLKIWHLPKVTELCRARGKSSPANKYLS